MTSLRAIPAVERILQALGEVGLPRPAVVAVVRRELAALRSAETIPGFGEVVARVRGALEKLAVSRLQPVINGTGVLIHTNLGRAPLGAGVVEALAAIGANYNNLEYDLGTGERGGRAAYVEHNLAVLCGAQAATAVNNCAAALVLIARHFISGARPEVVISRGELAQIGGGFRIAEILESSGARLREVGSTNKTTLQDYARALGAPTALVLRVHRSNFYMGGFVESPSGEELAALARRKRVPFVEDLGSGAMVDTAEFPGLEHEPTPREALAKGADLVCFSGDKLLGGPQAGLIAGKARLVAALKRAPLFRALRCDKLILSALQATIDLYLASASGKAPAAGLPLVEMLRVSTAALGARAERIAAQLEGLPVKVSCGLGKAQAGGGSLPRSVMESVSLDLVPENIGLAELSRRLRAGSPPVIGYPSGKRFKLDLRTVFPSQDAELARALRRCLADQEGGGKPD
jgi:L-seryl-tRNA(Ser) seleniumtransferase